MPGPITHLVIANEVLKNISSSIAIDEADFLSGALAPDAIHARAGFVRKDKKRTHLRQGIPDAEFHTNDNQELFNIRIEEFVREYLANDGEKFSLHLGYLVHLLTDESMLLTIRQDFTSSLIEEGIVPSDKEFFLRMMHDLDSNDNNLFNMYEDMTAIREMLVDYKSEGISGLLSAQELNNSRRWVIDNCFEDRKLDEPRYITHDSFKDFVKSTVENILLRLMVLNVDGDLQIVV